MSTLGFVGLGLMGGAMVRRLLDHGHSVTVWNRTPEKCAALSKIGARISQDVEQLAASHDIILSMLSTSDVVSDIADRVRGSAGKGTVHVDLSTISPQAADECERKGRASGQHFVHAPVLGSVTQVQEGALLIFAGGDAAAIDKTLPVMNLLGKRVIRFGTAPEASHMKLVCNFFISSMIMTLGQGLKVASSAGLDGSVLLGILEESALCAPMYRTKGDNILAGNFSPRFFLDHMLKDVRLFREATQQLGLDLSFGKILESAFQDASEAGYGKEDYSSVVKIL